MCCEMIKKQDTIVACGSFPRTIILSTLGLQLCVTTGQRFSDAHYTEAA